MPRRSASDTYQEIRQDLVHGKLTQALAKTQQANLVFSADPTWAIKFRLMQAEILSYEGLASPVIQLLACDAKTFTAAGDILIKRDILCAQEHAFLGSFAASDHELSEAEDLCNATHSSLRGELLRMNALISDEYKNEQETSINLYEKSLQAARASGDTFLESTDLLNLGMVALEREHFDEALDLFGRSATLAENIQALQVSQAALGNSGLAYLNLGDSMRALSAFQQAEIQAVANGVAVDRVIWLLDEGDSYYALGESAQAEASYKSALELVRSTHDFKALAGIDTGLGFLLYKKGHDAEATSYADNALRAAERSQNQDVALGPLLLKALIAAREPGNRAAEAQLLAVEVKSAGESAIRVASENALANFYAQSRRPDRADLYFQKAIRTFEGSRDTVKSEELKLPFFANADASYRDYADFLITTGHPDKALTLLDHERARTLSEGLGQSLTQSRGMAIDSLRPQNTARKLKATILFYALGQDKSYLWAINSRETRLFTLPKASELQSAIQGYNKSLLRSNDPLRDSDGNGTFLYQSLVSPAAPMIPANGRVIVVPDGALNQLNLETLIAPGRIGPHYWIEDVTVTNSTSIRMLTQGAVNRRPPAPEKLLLIGNPMNSDTGFAPLPHAASEMLSVESRFPLDARTVIEESAAIPSSYGGSQPERYAYIHFVAHGTASALSPLDSAVILSPAPQHPQAFKLYARDIIHHPIHARLVIISACNGSGMRAYAGEGLVGLSWAFLRAGAHNVIGALWQVDDAATPLMMDQLYAGLRGHHDTPDSALRQAKLALIHSGGVYRKPVYWGAFQLYTGS